MQHIKPTAKGDPLCPLGFHPQVRWPNRCKRCYRDYKEHGNRNKDQDHLIRKDELTLSTPALSTYSSRSREDGRFGDSTLGARTWTSSSNLSSTSSSSRPASDSISRGSSWTSSPNLADQKDDAVTVSVTLPRRRRPETTSDDGDEYKRTQYVFRRRATPVQSTESPSSTVETRSRTRERPAEAAPTPPVSLRTRSRTPSGQETSRDWQPAETPSIRTRTRSVEQQPNSEVDFIFRVKSASQSSAAATRTREREPPKEPEKKVEESEESSSSDDESTAATETTETTLVNPHEQQLQEEIDSLKRELDVMKTRCEKAERERSDLMLRRLASMETTSRTTASEVLKLQQKCNELKSNLEDVKDEKKVLSLRVRELEADLEVTRAKSSQREAEVLRAKLQKAESVVEELMEENEEMKKEMKDMEEEMVEMQDNFREDQADEYSTMKKELEQTTKNCRILTFKLRKSERRAEQLDAEKLEAERKLKELAGGQIGLDKVERIRKLEHDLSVANEAAARFQKELEDARSKKGEDGLRKKAPMLGSLPKTPSGEKMSRESLTRGGSQEDPVQLLRDLQDSLEREADLREQLRQTEEEAQNLRKKASRVEDDNESLVLQLKKMATKARTRKNSPSPQRPRQEIIEKDEGISDDDDPAELKILLELNEQEAAVLRRKVEDLESEGDQLKKKVRDLQDKLAVKPTALKKTTLKTASSEPAKPDGIYEKKMKVLEDEMGELRLKLIEKERECERLHAEKSLGVKKPKVLTKSKSLDLDQQAVDLKRQLQVVEAEASVLRTRIQTMESDNEKLMAENKRLLLLKATKTRSSSVERTSEEDKNKITSLEKQLEESKEKIKELEKNDVKKDTSTSVAEVEKIKTQLKKAETEKKKNEEALKRLKDEAIEDIINFYHKRTPKIPTDLTTKLQMKRMVEENEKEIGELIVALRKSEADRTGLLKTSAVSDEANKLKEELEAIKSELEKKLKGAQDECSKKEKELETLKSSISDLDTEKVKLKKEVDKFKTQFEKEKQKVADSKVEYEKEKKELVGKVGALQEEIRKSKVTSTELTVLQKKLDSLTIDLAEEKTKSEGLKKEIEAAKKSDADKSKVLKEAEEKANTVPELEKKLKEVEEKLSKSERSVRLKKDKLTKLEKEKEELNTRFSDLDKEKTELSKEKKDMSDKFKEAEEKIQKLQRDLTAKTSTIEQLEASLMREKQARDPEAKAENAAMNEINRLQEELTKTKHKLQEVTDSLEKVEKTKKEAEESAEQKKNSMEKEIEEWEKKASDLEMDLQATSEACAAERKMMERLKTNQEKEIKAKDLEIAQLRAKNHAAGAKKVTEVKQELQTKIETLELALESEKREYDELTSKYEQLEEEHVITKAQLVKEKEKLHSQLLNTERDYVEAEAELKALRETFNTKQDTWIKEKLDIQERLKENENWNLEKRRFQAICDEKQSELEHMKKESQGYYEQIESMRKENEELRKQMEDYEKVNKVQRTITADNSALEKQLIDCKTKLVMEEKARKTDLAALKTRYESRVSVISAELMSTQAQLARFKKERDSYKHMMEAAQKTVSEMKTSGGVSSSPAFEGEDVKDQIQALEQQISCLEDELSESRVEASRLRTELVSERSAWELKVSELSSRLNELEEEKILSSGRTKISGLKTKMELAWHKEREDQHRLLQETSTLARDLRQTLFEVERERDKERLEAKRRMEQLKKSSEEEQEEIRKKLNDMHCDLLELRDAHAKLRTTNEKLRREKEKLEKDREILKQSLSSKKRLDQEEERRIISVAQLVEELTVLAPGLFPTKPKQPIGTPTPPVRKRSREASPALEHFSRESSVSREDTKSHEVQEILTRLTEAANTLKRFQRTSEDRDSARKAFASRRAGSTESESSMDIPLKREGLRKKGSLLRKSLSLEQTGAQEQAIWKMDDDQGSLPSIQSLDEIDQYQHLHRRDPSLDSRLSGGSTRSEILPGDKKKKGGLFGKLKKLTKSSRSIDQYDGGSDIGSTGELDRGSDTSLSTMDEKGTKIKDKLSGMFRRSGSTSRGNSLERNTKPPTGLSFDSTQRPLVNSSALSLTEGLSSSRPLINDARKPPPAGAPSQRKVVKK